MNTKAVSASGSGLLSNFYIANRIVVSAEEEEAAVGRPFDTTTTGHKMGISPYKTKVIKKQ